MRTLVPVCKTKSKAEAGGNEMHISGMMTLEKFPGKYKDGFIVSLAITEDSIGIRSMSSNLDFLSG